MADMNNNKPTIGHQSKPSGPTEPPLYKWAEAEMVKRIINRIWLPGHPLPNEFDLADEFNVSQGTIRKALMSMEKKGLLVRQPGRGTSVSRTTAEEALFAFFRLRGDRGNIIVPETLSESIVRRAANETEIALFSSTENEVYELIRVRHNAGQPFVKEVIVLPTALFRGMELDLPLPSSLYPYLSNRFGITIMSASESVAAATADAVLASELEVEVGTPVLKVQRKARDLADRVVEARTSYYHTAFSTYQVELNRGDLRFI